MQSSSLVIAEVQPVLVFEDKDREFLDQFQEIAPILLQLVWTITPSLDKSRKKIKKLSKDLFFRYLFVSLQREP